MARVLVADNTLAARELYGFFLEQAGHDVVQAKNGKELERVVRLAKHRGEPVQALIVDLILPGIDLLEYLNGLASSGQLMPTILLCSRWARSMVESLLPPGNLVTLADHPCQPKLLIEWLETLQNRDVETVMTEEGEERRLCSER